MERPAKSCRVESFDLLDTYQGTSRESNLDAGDPPIRELPLQVLCHCHSDQVATREEGKLPNTGPKEAALYAGYALGMIEVIDQEILAILNNQEIVKERSLDELRSNGADDLSEKWMATKLQQQQPAPPEVSSTQSYPLKLGERPHPSELLLSKPSLPVPKAKPRYRANAPTFHRDDGLCPRVFTDLSGIDQHASGCPGDFPRLANNDLIKYRDALLLRSCATGPLLLSSSSTRHWEDTPHRSHLPIIESRCGDFL